MDNLRKTLGCLLLFLFAAVTSTYAQVAKQYSGTVTDADSNEPVIGVNVTLKDAQTGTVTDLSGKFSISAPVGSTLLFSYIGYVTKEVKLGTNTSLKITMQEDQNQLSEVVVIGYGVVKKSDITGAVASVSSKQFKDQPVKRVEDILQGRTAGVAVTSVNGLPGGTVKVRVRGTTSLNTSNDPLYVIDGIMSGGLDVNPADIQSIEVLKDASATAIYGSRGANGVVLVTTKKGVEGKVQIYADVAIGVSNILKKYDLLNAYEYATALKEYNGISFADDEMEAYKNGSKGIDWQNLMLQTGISQDYKLGISGGTAKNKYLISANVLNMTAMTITTKYQRAQLRINLDNELTKWLTLSTKINASRTHSHNGGIDIMNFLNYSPTMEMKDPVTGVYNMDPYNSVNGNPYGARVANYGDSYVYALNTNMDLTFKIMKGLTFRNNTGMRYQLYRRELFYGDQSIMGRRSGIYGSIRNTETGSFQTSNVLTYDKRFQKKHKVVVQLGQEFVKRWTRVLESGVSGLPTDEFILGDMSLGTPSVASSDENYDDNLLSFFARLNYDFTDKYLFSATFRADGSSKFGKNNKWGYFPAVSAAWRVSEENFIKKLNVFSDLKFRIGYGLAGNNRIGSYNSLALMSSIVTAMGDQLTPGYASKQIPNPDLKWEANKTFNMGIDLGFLNQRITISPEFYINRSSNLLLNAQLPYSSGYQTMLINAGETKNVGVEFTVNTVNFSTRKFSWNTTLTLSHNKNSVKALTGEAVQLYEAKFGFNQNTHRIAVGEPLGQFYGYITEGLYQVDDFNYDASTQTYTLKDGVPYHGDKGQIRPGMWKFKNLTGDDNVIDENDKTVIGNAQPKFYGGLNNSFTYKGFDLSIFLTFSYGNEVLNATKLVTSKVGSLNYNALDVMNSSNRWMTINTEGEKVTDPGELAVLNAGKTVAVYHDAQQGDNYIHSWAVEDASYLKLSNVTLGYTFPKNLIARVGLKNLRLYATGNNLLTWTKYSGFDPEVSTMKSGLTPGVDFGAYPLSRSFIFGLNVAF